jgi:hypothetical protein
MKGKDEESKMYRPVLMLMKGMPGVCLVLALDVDQNCTAKLSNEPAWSITPSQLAMRPIVVSRRPPQYTVSRY